MSFTERKLANCRLKESNDVGNFGRGMTSSEHLTLNSGFGGGIRGRVWGEMKRGMLELPISHPSRFLDSRACLQTFHVPSILILINNLKLMNFIRWLNLFDMLRYKHMSKIEYVSTFQHIQWNWLLDTSLTLSKIGTFKPLMNLV